MVITSYFLPLECAKIFFRKFCLGYPDESSFRHLIATVAIHCLILLPISNWFDLIYLHLSVTGQRFLLRELKMGLLSRGGHLYFRLDIILVKGLSKHTLNTYFKGVKIDPKYMFLHAVFLNLSVMSFPKFVKMTKNTPFFSNFAYVFAPLNDVRTYIALS